MSDFQLTGLASGFDWGTMVDQLMDLQRVPQDRLRVEQNQNDLKLSLLGDFRSQLTGLQDAVNDLSSDDAFAKRSLSFSDESLGWTATAAENATQGDYTFEVTKVATRSMRSGASNVARSINATNDVSSLLVSEMRLSAGVTLGTFSVNGQTVEVEEADTLQDVFDKIATATGGSVAAAYDAGTDQVTLSSATSISLGGGADSSNFLYALKLYNNDSNSVSSASALGAVSLNDTIADAGLSTAVTAVDGNGDGSFSINGVSIDFNVNDDSLQDVIARVNSSDAEVTMVYDAITDRLSLTNKNTGDVDVTVSESAGGLMEALGLNSTATVARGANAEFTLNGSGTIVSASNSLDAGAHGIQGLTVTATEIGEQTVSVNSDTSGVDAGIRSFIEKFNAVQTFIDDTTSISVDSEGSVSAALLSDNRELDSIGRRLRSTAFGEVAGMSGTIRRLESLGIDFDGSAATLTIKDEAKLAEALSNNLDEVEELFTKPTSGLVASFDTYISQLVDTSGLIDTQETSLERQNQSLDTQIAEIERRLEVERNRLEASFISMEQAQAQTQSQLAALQSTLNLG